MASKIEFTAVRTLPYTYRGITWTSPVQHQFQAIGTPSGGNSNLWVYQSSTKPSWLEYDTNYQFKIERTGQTANIQLLVQFRVNGSYQNLFIGTQDSIMNIPTANYDYFNIVVRVLNGAGATNEIAYPYLYKMETYSPRLNSNGMVGSKYWYDSNWNPYYPADGLPNCTCYAWGRWAEIMDAVPTGLGLHNAETWWAETTGYNKGQTPKLGAIICFADGPYSGLGHVAVVEQIDADGTVTFSNSAYNGQYFYLRSGKAENNYGYESAYRLQGFIYLPDEYDPHPPQPIPPIKFNKPLWFYCKRKPF